MTTAKPQKTADKSISCGLVMPISSIDGCSSDHWIEIKNIIIDAVEGIAVPKFSVKLVSDADDVGVIQKRIVQNVYSSDIIVCDVSGKNPNVMFELGMRLAFDKPTVIVKDDKTDYAFDTGIIEHIPYPRDLRFSRIVTFKNSLAEKVLATHRAAESNSEHSTFLKNFGKFQVASLTESVVPADRMVFEMLSELQMEVSRLRRTMSRGEFRRPPIKNNKDDDEASDSLIDAIVEAYILENPKKNPGELLESKDLYRYVAERIIAPDHFDSPAGFQNSIDRAIRRMIRLLG